MYITKLTAENFKLFKLIEVDLDASGGVTTISGPNGAGKTSLIDALAVVIAGRNAPKIPHPIRKGEDAAAVVAETDTGLIITRRWKRKDDDSIVTDLVISNSAGMERKSPQALLDTFLAGFALDPIAFERAKPADQVAELLTVIPDLPFVPAELDVEFDDLFTTRTSVNRKVTELTGQLAGMPRDNDAPASEQSASELLAQLDVITKREAERRDITTSIAERERNISQLTNQIAELTEQLASNAAGLERDSADLAALPEFDDTAEASLRERIANVDAINSRVRANIRRAEVAEELANASTRSQELSEELEGIKQRRADGLAAATLPYPGLGFGDDGITLDGVPFSQASAAQRLVASTAIAAAGNPELQLVLVRDGSNLDSKYMARLADYAVERNLRVIVEVVDEHAETGIIIADGEIV